jgi:predicted nucleotidyltransferase
MQISQETIDNLVGRIKKVVEPKEVILFGSAARGLMAHDSDIDVLVVVPAGTHRRHTCQHIHRNLLGFEFPVDVIVATREDLEKHKNNPGLIYQNILNEGKTVYATP